MQGLITVLIADDETAIRYGLEEIVESAETNIKVIATAENGGEALSFLEQYEPDIAIIDINMPVYDGLQVIEQAVGNNCKTRFFILSGYNDFTYAQTAIRFGVKNYFLKPLNIGEFCKELARHCQEIRAERQEEENMSPQRLAALVQSSKVYFLNQLIEDRLHTTEEINYKLKELQLTLDNNIPCLVAVLSFSGTGTSERPDLSELITDDFRSFFPAMPMEYWLYGDTQVLCVFHQDNPGDPVFRRHLSACAAYYQEQHQLTVTIGIGDTVASLDKIARSYLSALEAMSYHIYDAEARIYDTSVICQEKAPLSRENINYKPIIHAITHGNAEAISDYCHTFLSSLLFIKMPPPNFFIGMCMYLVMNVQKQITLLYPEQQLEFEFRYEELDALGSVDAIREWMISFFIRYSDLLKSRPETDNSIIKAAKEYIRHNLHKNIKASDVARHVNLSSSYFTIYFKDKTSINFRDYLLNSRISHAKKLLLAGESTVGEIAYLVGYQDYRSFSRAFKNETGMSPREYTAGISGNRRELPL